jgi:ribosomal protein L6P/L9E
MFNNNKFEKLPIFTFVKKESFRINFISLKQIFIEFLGPYGSIKKLFFIKENNFLIEPYNNTANFDKFIFFSNSGFYKSFFGLINSTFLGLFRGFYFEFIIRGIGFKYKFFKKNGKFSLLFKLGFGHRVLYNLNQFVSFRSNRRFDFVLFSMDKSILRNFAENLLNIKRTDSYKGKGIKYYRLPLKLKVGKVR